MGNCLNEKKKQHFFRREPVLSAFLVTIVWNLLLDLESQYGTSTSIDLFDLVDKICFLQ